MYVDGNAVSPQSRPRHRRDGRGRGGQVSGWRHHRRARLAARHDAPLSFGQRRERDRRLFDGTPLSAIVLDGPAAAASALKMAYAGWTKGTSALLAGLLAVALREGVLEPLLAEWESTGLRARADGLGSAAAKAWRWAGEMDEIALTFRECGLPAGFHEAAADLFRRLERFKEDPDAPGGADLARWLV